MSLTTQRQARRRLALLFSVPFGFSLVFLAVFLLADHTEIELLGIQNLSSSIAQLRAVAADLEAGERGLLLTDQEQFLSTLEQARSSLRSQIDSCLRYAKERPTAIQNQVAQF